MNFTALSGQSTFCLTQGTGVGLTCVPELQSMDEKGPFFIRIYVHVIRRDDNTGGQSTQDVEEALGYLDEAFNPHNIFFMWDCVIDEINNSDLYIDVFPDTNLFTDPDNHPNSDGIDIYLFPDHPAPNALGAGNSSDIGGGALYVTGNYLLAPHGSLVKSHTLSHEMGHCLGLLHTHNHTDGDGVGSFLQTANEIVSRTSEFANCDVAGDCICDTPADKRFANDVTHPGCLWIGFNPFSEQHYDSQGDPYEPSTINIMSYTHNECLQEFTLGQGKRMRNAIVYLTLLQGFLAKRTIDTPTIWDINNTPSGVVEIEGTLEIEPGASLTIEEGITVRFKEKTRLIIKANAELILKGTLTSSNCGSSNTWKGVEVWGSSLTHQFSVNGIRTQGRFSATSTALVENAEVAVQLWGENKYFDAGGIISCTGTSFKNNIRGVDFFTYENHYPDTYPPSLAGKPTKYLATLTSCKFLNDSDYPHATNFESFINMIQVNVPAFKACSFINEGYTPITFNNIGAYGYGIYSYKARFSVLPLCTTNTYPCPTYAPSMFKGLGYGVYTGVPTGINAPTFTVEQADFYDCFVGVYNLGGLSATLLFNHFYLGNLPTLQLATDQIGIALTSNMVGLTLEDNYFTQVQGDAGIRTIGISSYRTGDHTVIIRNNNFTGLHIGNQAGGKCGNGTAGLLYLCNVNRFNTEFDFLICEPEFPAFGNRIRTNQKDIDISTGLEIAAGNKFSNTGTPSDRDFANSSSLGLPINYYYKMNGGILERPDEYTGINDLIASTENTCPPAYCKPPCKTTAEIVLLQQAFYLQKNNFQTAYSDYLNALNTGSTTLATQKLSEASAYRLQMDKSGHQLLLHELADEENVNRENIRTLLAEMNYYGAEMRLVFDYLDAGEVQEGLVVLSAIPTKFNLTSAQLMDVSNAYILYNILASANEHDLSPVSIAQIESIAQAEGEYTAAMSKSILTQYGQFFPVTFCAHPTSLQGENDSKKAKLARTISKFTVYPNPAHGQVTFERVVFNKKANLVLMDITGKVVWEKIVKEGEKRFLWPTADKPAGVYFYQWITDGAIENSGRLIIQK